MEKKELPDWTIVDIDLFEELINYYWENKNNQFSNKVIEVQLFKFLEIEEGCRLFIGKNINSGINNTNTSDNEYKKIMEVMNAMYNESTLSTCLFSESEGPYVLSYYKQISIHLSLIKNNILGIKNELIDDICKENNIESTGLITNNATFKDGYWYPEKNGKDFRIRQLNIDDYNDILNYWEKHKVFPSYLLEKDIDKNLIITK